MITGVMSCSVYVDDFEKALRFYGEVLQLKPGPSLGDTSRFFCVGDNQYGLFVDGGYKPVRISDDQTHAAFTLTCESAQALFDRLKSANAEVLADAPKDMGKGYFWFQFRDPAGNILEAISGPKAS
jgi:predicted enzyme related to lactoylglutathione lyase